MQAEELRELYLQLQVTKNIGTLCKQALLIELSIKTEYIALHPSFI